MASTTRATKSTPAKTTRTRRTAATAEETAEAPKPRTRRTTAATEEPAAPRTRRRTTTAAEEPATPRTRRRTAQADEPATPPRRRRATAPAEPEQPAATPDGEVDLETLTAEVPFRGRMILVKMPTLEQLTIFRRLADRFAALQDKEISAEEALRYYDRGLRIITAVVVKDDDKAWIEDLLLDGEMRLPDGLPLLHQATEALKEEADSQGNRATRRKAARRTPRR